MFVVRMRCMVCGMSGLMKRVVCEEDLPKFGDEGVKMLDNIKS